MSTFRIPASSLLPATDVTVRIARLPGRHPIIPRVGMPLDTPTYEVRSVKSGRVLATLWPVSLRKFGAKGPRRGKTHWFARFTLFGETESDYFSTIAQVLHAALGRDI